MNKPRRGRPDMEAESVEISADRIAKPKKFYRNAKHNGNRAKADGNVRVTVFKEHREKILDEIFRPKKGEVFEGDENSSVVIEAKRIEKHTRRGERDSASASRDVRIFGKLRRRKE